MAAYEPDLFRAPAGVSNVPGRQDFTILITYGNAAPASAWGAYMGLRDVATGKLTALLPKTYRKLVGVNFSWLKCQAGAVLLPVVLTDAVATADATTGGGSITFETRTEAGTATDPASGDILEVTISVSNDVLVDGYAVTIT